MHDEHLGIVEATTTDTWRGGASFSLRNRLYRIAFSLAWLLLARWTPPQMHGWRRALLRTFGAEIAATAMIYSSAKIWSPQNLAVGDFACIAPRVIVYSMAPIRLESYAIISQGVHLCAGTHDIEDPNFQLQARPIHIGARAWVAADAFVGPGVTIGRGSVLGARAVAFRDLDAWTVYVGNPAKPLRPRRVRFPDAPT